MMKTDGEISTGFPLVALDLLGAVSPFGGGPDLSDTAIKNTTAETRQNLGNSRAFPGFPKGLPMALPLDNGMWLAGYYLQDVVCGPCGGRSDQSNLDGPA